VDLSLTDDCPYLISNRPGGHIKIHLESSSAISRPETKLDELGEEAKIKDRFDDRHSWESPEIAHCS